ncbi:hypothetical protein KC347_g1941 [Hortaea werneckii]|nr:hypothetical protein KC347_g1941 [Hortaea werneckii]
MRLSTIFATLVATATALEPAPLEERKAGDGKDIVKYARKAIGVPYVWAGGDCNGKTGGGFDCSGLNVYAVCKATGEELPPNSQMQYDSYKKHGGKRVKWQDAKPGDLYYFGRNGNCKTGIEHTNIMSKKGHVINAPGEGKYVSEPPFWREDSGLEICPYALRFW